VNILVRDSLVTAGWTVMRDNEDNGGALVLVAGGLQIVGGFHAYPEPLPSVSLAGEVIDGEDTGDSHADADFHPPECQSCGGRHLDEPPTTQIEEV
jgi:hypothetical protein